MNALPERLGRDGMNLAVTDLIIGVVVIVLAAFLHEARAATLVAMTCVLASGAIGRYQASFAVHPQDERYSVASAAVIAAIALIALVPLFEVSALACAVALVLWSCGSAVAASRFTQYRRAQMEQLDATCRYLSPRSRARARDGVARGATRLVDGTFAAIGLVVLSPVLLACAVAIYFEDRGNPIFRQMRAGLDGRPFVMYKFRTMRADAGTEWATENDERITRVGAFLRRTSLDELPQLWNVLRGDMSLVGPRPEMCEYAEEFAHSIQSYEDRHAIPPGITGWAQIHFRRNFQPDESSNVVPYDLFYVANYSMPLYVYCLTKTAFEVISHRAV